MVQKNDLCLLSNIMQLFRYENNLYLVLVFDNLYMTKKNKIINKTY